MNPWVEALLWGAVGLAVAMTIAFIAMAFTRGAGDDEKDERHPR